MMMPCPICDSQLTAALADEIFKNPTMCPRYGRGVDPATSPIRFATGGIVPTAGTASSIQILLAPVGTPAPVDLRARVTRVGLEAVQS